MDKKPRILTEDEECAIRHCHHDFGRRTIKDAAVRMGLRQRDVRQLLRTAEAKAPQLFPLLSPRQAAVLELYSDSPQLSRKEVCRQLDLSINQLRRAVTFLRHHKLLVHPTIYRYRPSMDPYITEKF
jgi:hypothetical protein